MARRLPPYVSEIAALGRAKGALEGVGGRLFTLNVPDGVAKDIRRAIELIEKCKAAVAKAVPAEPEEADQEADF